MELSATLSASIIGKHPYIFTGIILYAIIIAWVVYEMKNAPLVQNQGDELPLEIDDLYNYSTEPDDSIS